MSQIPEKLLSDLMQEFKSEIKIKNIIKNKELYKLENYNINQLFKIFNRSQENIFIETNSKKHLTKIQEMIKTNFFNNKTNHYLNFFFNPTNNQKIYENRKNALSNININITEEDGKKIKEIIKNIKNINTRIMFKNRILTLEHLTEKILFEKYKINCEFVSKKELEQIIPELDAQTIIISEDNLYTEIPVYTLKEFEKIIVGNIIKTNKLELLEIIDFLKITKDNKEEIIQGIKLISELELNVDFDLDKLKEILNENQEDELKEVSKKVLELHIEVENINKQIKEIISQKKLSLQGDELLELLNSGDMTSLQNKFKEDTKKIISDKEKDIIEYFKSKKIKINFIFEDNNYPLKLEESVKDELLKSIDILSQENEFKLFEELGKFEFIKIKQLWQYIIFFDLFFNLKKFENKYNLKYPKIGNEMKLIEGVNLYIDNPMPISYAIGSNSVAEQRLQGEKVSILTGANSGGKTTLLEMFIQSNILTSMGLGINASESSEIKIFDEIIYLKKFTGTQGSGAFEQTIRNLVGILDSDSSKFILVDEFEAVTEPGAAARILIMFLKEIQNQDSFCIAVSHLGQEISEFIKEENIKGIRIDGISASGLGERGELITEHQPKFYELGKSTPELILKRILQDEKFWIGKSKKSKEIFENLL